jgi:thymidylate kinase
VSPAPIQGFAYHFFARIVPTEEQPHFYLNVSPTRRYRQSQIIEVKTERFETMEELSKTAHKAMDLVSDGKWIVLDGDEPIRMIHKDILRVAGVK